MRGGEEVYHHRLRHEHCCRLSLLLLFSSLLLIGRLVCDVMSHVTTLLELRRGLIHIKFHFFKI